MNPDADKLWHAPRWALAILLAVLGMLGPFSIDTYIPAFSGIASSIGATPVEMQQTLSAYLFGFAFMNLFHGALSDSFGRRPVVLWGLAVFTLASLGCALSQTIGQLVLFRALQGLSTGAGIVVSRAVIRDMFPPAAGAEGDEPGHDLLRRGAGHRADRRRLPVRARWAGTAIFWFLVAVGVVLFAANYKLLPETLHVRPAPALRGAPPDARLLASCAPTRASCCWRSPAACPSTACSSTCSSAPAFLGDHLGLAPTQFFWFFLLTIGGIMAGAWASGRMAGKVPPKRQIRDGFLIMLIDLGGQRGRQRPLRAACRPGRCGRSRSSPSAGR